MDPSHQRDAYLDAVLIGGRESVDIVVVDYDPDWPQRFANVRDRISDALGSTAHAIEHVGSTAVPGLAAKPIIDVLLTVDRADDEVSYVPALVSAGFELRVREPAHRMLRTTARDVHIHVYEPTHPDVRDLLDLRDRLRRSRQDRDLYERTKRQLASRAWRDMNDYAEAKTDVIADILTRARKRPTEPETKQ